MPARSDKQHVCQVCGYNMVGYIPTTCPFCGAASSHFLKAEENSLLHEVRGTPVNDRVTRYNSWPLLGIEHSSYQVRAGGASFMIDCPSSFDPDLPRVDMIAFTHSHFLGANNQYRKHFSAKVAIHLKDFHDRLCKGFYFNARFSDDFSWNGLTAMHLGGHTPGFTCYFFEDVLFICDYVIPRDDGMILNPYGPEAETCAGLAMLLSRIPEGSVRTVCGVSYVMDFPEWREMTEKLV